MNKKDVVHIYNGVSAKNKYRYTNIETNTDSQTQKTHVWLPKEREKG